MSDVSCPKCGQRLYSRVHRDAHKQLYPDHFDGKKSPLSTKEDAVLVDLKPKRSNSLSESRKGDAT